ncbi:MAG TPA: Na+/H+ antiporter NhaC family protein [Bacillota bacterium]|nr:Na+/H+ antiporter NhaC family protein [Bacillota bacterium]
MVDSSWVSLIPFLVVIPMAIWLKEILPGLVLGLLVGAYIVSPTWLGGIEQTVHYIIHTLSNQDNIKIVSFLYLFGGLVGMMQISGGIKGFANWVSRKIHTQKGFLWLIWLTIPFTFITPMFRIMMIGPVLKSLYQKVQLSKERVGYTMDVSTEPIVVLLPVATAFVGFMVSVVGGSMEQNKITGSPYHIFLSSLPYNLFAWVTLLVGLITTFGNGSKISGDVPRPGIEQQNDLHRAGIEKELSAVRAQPWHLIYPLFLLLSLTISLLWQNGREQGVTSFLGALAKADATFVMFIAVLITLLLTLAFYLFRRQPLQELLFHFFDGGNQLMTANILLILVWSLSLVAQDLGFSTFVSSTLGNVLPPFLVPTIIFVLGSFVSYFIGSSWGTWGLFMPLGVSLAAATGGSLAVTVGAVFASGTFGAFASPLGDTTITTASILEIPLLDYARYKLRISLFCGIITVCLYLVLGFFIR